MLTDLRPNANVPNFDFPFKTALSFKKLIDYWKYKTQSKNKVFGGFAEEIIQILESKPELHEPIKDIAVLEENKEVIMTMMSTVFPFAFWDKQACAATVPFSMKAFHASERFRELFTDEHGYINLQNLNIQDTVFHNGKTVGAFVAILKNVYKLNVNMEFPMIYKYIEPGTGLERYYKMNFAEEFVDLVVKDPVKPLTEEEKRIIMMNLTDVNLLKTIIPVDNFEIQGFMVINAIDITGPEIISALKFALIERDAIVSKAGFENIEQKLRSLLKIPGLRLGVTAIPGDSEQLFKYGTKIGHSFILNQRCIKSCDSLEGSVYETLFDEDRPFIVDNLETYPGKTMVEEELLAQGIRNILLAPLIYNGETVGILELASPEAGSINLLNALKLQEVLPLFAVALARNMEELNNKVQSVIKEKCTAIHPSVEWRFREAALNLIMKENSGEVTEFEDIVFNEVYPLYGLSDIRNSSVQRNNSIREDLITNLNMANEIIHVARSYKPIAALDEMGYRIGKQIEAINFGLSSGDEAQILGFLKNQIEPLFNHIKSYDPEVKKYIDKYTASIDSKLGFIYKKRKDFEESVTRLNDVIANYIDAEQDKVQAVFPHYFEKYKTDGVDHSIYVGASLAENGRFNKIYLRNLRLWQLMMMCGIVKKTAMLKNTLSTPLETAQLILVQDIPLSIKFHLDQKKFDVDGAYNIRYEIMKKRIDKAEIRGGEERLTQPGKIAVVYSQQSEANEYYEYLDYLQALDLIDKNIEQYDLEELQGVQGLKALRVTVNTGIAEENFKINGEDLEKAVKALN
jgi:GAF domain-containing protein